MFLLLSKMLDFLLEPVAWAILLALGAALARRRTRLAAALALASAGVLYLFSAPHVANALMRRAEAPAKSTYRPDVVYDAVIVLSGEIEAGASSANGQLELTAAADRLTNAYGLLRSGRARAALLSGGSAFPAPGDRSEAELVAAALADWGIPSSRLVVEGESRNTHENATAAARIAASRGWKSILLLTSAYHMPRALGCFRRAGLSPDALPVDHRSAPVESTGWLPRADALGESTEAIHEWVGRLAYWVMGYTA